MMLFLNIFLQCPSAYAANYLEVHRDENYIVTLDVSSLKDHGDYVTVLEGWIFRGEVLEEQKKISGKNFSYVLFVRAYKVSDKKFQIMRYAEYSEDGKCLESFQIPYDPNKFKTIPPNSFGVSIWEKVMALTNH